MLQHTPKTNSGKVIRPTSFFLASFKTRTFLSVLYICQSAGCAPVQLLPVFSSPTNVPIRLSNQTTGEPFHLHESFMLPKTPLTLAGTNPVDRLLPLLLLGKQVHLLIGDLSPLSPSTSLPPSPSPWQPDLLCASSSVFCLYLAAAVSFILYLISWVLFPFFYFSIWPQYEPDSLHAHPHHTQWTKRWDAHTLVFLFNTNQNKNQSKHPVLNHWDNVQLVRWLICN